MKIFINAINAKMGGFKTLINSAIQDITDDGNDYVLLIHPSGIDKQTSLPSNVKVIETRIGDSNYVLRFLWYQLYLPMYLLFGKYHRMINLTNYGPLYCPCKNLLLLHNSKHVSELMYKNANLKKRIQRIIDDFVFQVSIYGSTYVSVQTNYMKQGMLKRYKIKPEKIIVIPTPPKKPKIQSFSSSLDDQLKLITQGKKKIFSTITLFSNHKDLYTLVDAVNLLEKKDKEEILCILTIDEQEGEQAKEFLEYIQKLDLNDTIKSVGNVENTFIHQILGVSDGFIFPSLEESFGIPFVESLYNNVPIITSDLEFSHNVCGKAARYFIPGDAKSLANELVNFDSTELSEEVEVKKKYYAHYNFWEKYKGVISC